ncbi:hypothetical protein CROQUDRAFT_552899 [Cronartium quercuum f. sp. fusiforme G11]|uniref:Uncharacterized protein n=1 Tax=Cronartium quercuum f. sp. fusiforme G11 TaxID=708437 RepID=A0A9P6NHP8_9BASI|nr:hypothetical protein CROQUDRAFT_552899 [Cronartium quercuum f. sp. fusiforme G11]
MSRSGETPYERRERLNLEKAIELSKATNTNSTHDSMAHASSNNSPCQHPNTPSPIDLRDVVIPDSQADSSLRPQRPLGHPSQSRTLEGVEVTCLPVILSDTSLSIDSLSEVAPSTLILGSNPNNTSPIVSVSTNINPSREPGWSKSKFRDTSPISAATPHITLKHQLLSTDPIEQSSLPPGSEQPFSLISLPHPHLIVPETASVESPSRAVAIKSKKVRKPTARTSSSNPGDPQPSSSIAATPPTTKQTKVTKSRPIENELAPPSEETQALRSGKRVRKQSAIGESSARSLHALLTLSQSEAAPVVPPKRTSEPVPAKRITIGPAPPKHENEPEPGPSQVKRKSHTIADSEDDDDEVTIVNPDPNSCQSPKPSNRSPKNAHLNPLSSPLSSPVEELGDPMALLRPSKKAVTTKASSKRPPAKSVKNTKDSTPANPPLKETSELAIEMDGPSSTKSGKPKRGRKPKQRLTLVVPPPPPSPPAPSVEENPLPIASTSRKSPKRPTSPTKHQTSPTKSSVIVPSTEETADKEAEDEAQEGPPKVSFCFSFIIMSIFPPINLILFYYRFILLLQRSPNLIRHRPRNH